MSTKVRRETLIQSHMQTGLHCIFNWVAWVLSFSNRPIYIRVHLFRTYNSFTSYFLHMILKLFLVQWSKLLRSRKIFCSQLKVHLGVDSKNKMSSMGTPHPTKKHQTCISNITVHKIPFVHGISKLYAVWCKLSGLGSTSRIVILLLKSHNSEEHFRVVDFFQ